MTRHLTYRSISMGVSIRVDYYWGDGAVGFDLDKNQAINLANAILENFKADK